MLLWLWVYLFTSLLAFLQRYLSRNDSAHKTHFCSFERNPCSALLITQPSTESKRINWKTRGCLCAYVCCVSDPNTRSSWRLQVWSSGMWGLPPKLPVSMMDKHERWESNFRSDHDEGYADRGKEDSWKAHLCMDHVKSVTSFRTWVCLNLLGTKPSALTFEDTQT